MAGRAVVTGGEGFIGRAVVARLIERGWRVRVVDDLSKPGSRSGVGARRPGAEHVQQDLADAARTAELFEGFDVCINLAARIGGIGYFHRYPADILSDNNRIYSSTFRAAVQARMSRMVYVSSSMVFESATRFPSRESDLGAIPPPRTAYGCSKLIGEWYCRAFWDQFRLPYTIVRPFNAYGVNEAPGDEVGYAHVIPDLVKKILQGQHPLELLGDGRQTRCFTHVSDIAGGIVTAVESEAAANEDFNISSPVEITILELARLLHQLCEVARPFEVRYVDGFEHDIRRRVPDVGKARRLLGWEARYRLEDKLPEVVAWLRETLEKGGAARAKAW